MKFQAKNEEDADKIIEELDKLTNLLIQKTKINKEDIPSLKEYLNEELLELHYCRKGTRMQIKTTDIKTKKIMVADIIGHLLSEIPEKDRNDVLLMAVGTTNLDDLTD
jgi:NCAIR mutase (PurE)-related protein